MPFFKQLDINWKPVAVKLQLYLKLHPTLLQYQGGSWREAPDDILLDVPELGELFKPLDITIRRVGFFIQFYNIGAIHTDPVPETFRINFPIVNCDQSETKFFTVKEPPSPKVQPNGRPYNLFQLHQVEEAGSFYLTDAYILNVKEPHQVIVHLKKFPRVSCTVAFNEDISHLI
jgi:hypothetical protein